MTGADVDGFRYVLALLLVVLMPPAGCAWLVIHPFVQRWRRVGVVWAYAAVTTYMALASGALFLARKPLLAWDLGTSVVSMVAAAPLLAAWIALALARRRVLALGVMAGLPELAPERFQTELLTEGIYAHVRHPRYVEGILGSVGMALVANHPAAYGAVALFGVGIWLTARAEERELSARFGEAYESYCRRVPRFLPRLRRSAKQREA